MGLVLNTYMYKYGRASPSAARIISKRDGPSAGSRQFTVRMYAGLASGQEPTQTWWRTRSSALRGPMSFFRNINH